MVCFLILNMLFFALTINNNYSILQQLFVGRFYILCWCRFLIRTVTMVLVSVDPNSLHIRFKVNGSNIQIHIFIHKYVVLHTMTYEVKSKAASTKANMISIRRADVNIIQMLADIPKP